MKNDIYILYKRTAIDAVTAFKNRLTAVNINKGSSGSNDLNDFVIKDYNDALSVEEINYQVNNSAILLCFVDDEFFYDMNCRTVWFAFMNRQGSISAQIIFPVLLKKVVPDNFDVLKKDIFDTMNNFGFYSIDNDDEIRNLCEDMIASRTNISIEGNNFEEWTLVNHDTNVFSVYEIGREFIEGFRECNKSDEHSQRTASLEAVKEGLKNALITAHKEAEENIKKKTEGKKGKKGVCVLYTGGTAGMIHDDDSKELIQADMRQLINKLPRLKREDFDIFFYSFKEPLDSSNILSEHWLVMAAVVESLKDTYQGFVIIHGANTMAYSAAALSFLLDGVDRPIILTGSELALTELNTDAEQNIQRSIEIASHDLCHYENVRDVCILFGRRLIRGNRSTKQISLDTTEGFYSPNYPDLASVANDRVVIDSSRLSSRPVNLVSSIAANYDITSKPGVLVCDIYPDMDMNMFRENCCKEEIGAVIIRTYGTGGVPDDDDVFKDCLKKLKDQNKVVVNLTQCPRGNVELRIFETNAVLFNYGVISGGDMVTEAAYCKLKHLFSKFKKIDNLEDKANIIRHYMMVSMRDELTMSAFTVNFGKKQEKLIFQSSIDVSCKAPKNWCKNPAVKYSDTDGDYYAADDFATFDTNAHITSAVLRLSGVRILDGEKNVVSSDDGRTKVTPSVIVSLSRDSISSSSVITIHRKEYVYTYKSPKIDINIDVLKQVNHVIVRKPPSDLHITINSEQHSIEVEHIHLLLSVDKKRKG